MRGVVVEPVAVSEHVAELAVDVVEGLLGGCREGILFGRVRFCSGGGAPLCLRHLRPLSEGSWSERSRGVAGGILFGGVRFRSAGFGAERERLVGVEVEIGVGGLAELLELFGGGREQAVGFGVAAAVVVDGDAALGEFAGAFGFIAPDLGEGSEQEAEFTQVGEALLVLRILGLSELDQVADDLVGGEFADQVGAEEFVVAQVAGDGGDGAVISCAIWRMVRPCWRSWVARRRPPLSLRDISLPAYAGTGSAERGERGGWIGGDGADDGEIPAASAGMTER